MPTWAVSRSSAFFWSASSRARSRSRAPSPTSFATSTTESPRGAARTTIKKELNTLSAALTHAGNRGWVPHSSAIEYVPPFAAQSEPRTRWLTLDEFPKLLAALDTTEWMAKRVSNLEPDEAERKLREHGELVAGRQLFVTVACFTGAELSALSRLDWTDVDLMAGRIRIPGAKNAIRDRTIDLDP